MLGATRVLSRSTLQMGTRPLEKAMWAGAIDPVGGDTLAWLTRTMMLRRLHCRSGLTGGTELKTTVMPFILRGVKLLGIDSAMCPMDDAPRGVAASGDRHEADSSPTSRTKSRWAICHRRLTRCSRARRGAGSS